MPPTTSSLADDYCDEHLLEVRRDPGEADPDGRVKRADHEYASMLLVEEMLHEPRVIAALGFDPRRVMLTPARTRAILTTLRTFAPFCCTLGPAVRERVLRKSRHPPIEYELERRTEHALRAHKSLVHVHHDAEADPLVP